MMKQEDPEFTVSLRYTKITSIYRTNSLSKLWHMGLVAPQRAVFSNTRDQTCVSCIGRGVLQLKIVFLILGFPGSGGGKEPACQSRKQRDLRLIPGLGRSHGGGHENPLQYFCLENPHGQRSLESYSPWDHKELDTTEATQCACIEQIFIRTT